MPDLFKFEVYDFSRVILIEIHEIIDILEVGGSKGLRTYFCLETFRICACYPYF